MPILYPTNIPPTEIEKENNEFSSSISVNGLNLTYPFEGSFFAFDVDKTTLQLIRSKVKLLFDVDYGEWRYKPEYGLGIRKYLFEQITEESLELMKEETMAQIKRWIPEAKVKHLALSFDGKDYLTIEITYSLASDTRETETLTKIIELK